MQRFIIYTRGRTGSSAIVDELNKHPDIVCHGEIFRSKPLQAPGLQAAYDRYGRDYPKMTQSMDRVLPYRLFIEDEPDASGFPAYFEYLEAEAGQAGAVGGKVIDSHMPVEQACDLCARHDVAIISLRRRNLLRQAVSGYVAKETGRYNTRKPLPDEERSFTVNVPGIISRIRVGLDRQAEHDAALSATSARWKEVYYEDWCDDRGKFFAELSDFLGVPHVVPDTTNFQQTTPEPLAEIVSNYNHLANRLNKAGFGAFLEE